MKKLITAILILTAFSAKAQYYGGMQFGYSTKNKLTGALIGGYQFTNQQNENKAIVLEGQMKFHIDRVNPAYFNAMAGYNFPLTSSITITPLAGSGYRLQSTDNKELNTIVWVAALRLEWKSNTIEYCYTDKTQFITIGIRALKGRDL